jgi:hypothetical protein
MYRLGELEYSHHRFYIWLAAFVIFILAAILVVSHFLKATTQIGNAPAVVTTNVNYNTAQTTTFTEPLFTINLPTGWKPAIINDTPTPTYTWQGTSGEDKQRWLDVYVDDTATLKSLAVNRELYVQGHQNMINVLSDVSDNCTTFTGISTTQNQGSVPAKWQGINFLCDTSNYERDVVGTASPNGLNDLTVSGSTGSHNFFFTYTDNSASPDYSIFTSALKSFKLK